MILFLAGEAYRTLSNINHQQLMLAINCLELDFDMAQHVRAVVELQMYSMTDVDVAGGRGDGGPWTDFFEDLFMTV